MLNAQGLGVLQLQKRVALTGTLCSLLSRNRDIAYKEKLAKDQRIPWQWTESLIYKAVIVSENSLIK